MKVVLYATATEHSELSRTVNANEKVTDSNGKEPGTTLTIHNQNFSQIFLGGGSSYVSASTSSKPVTKSISSTFTNLLSIAKLATANRIGPNINGR